MTTQAVRLEEPLVVPVCTCGAWTLRRCEGCGDYVCAEHARSDENGDAWCDGCIEAPHARALDDGMPDAAAWALAEELDF